MKINLLLMLLVLSGSVCSQDQGYNSPVQPVAPAQVYIQVQTGGNDSREVYAAVAEAFCEGVGEGLSCRVPKPLDREVRGVCCGGSCRFMAGDCKQRPVNYDFYDALRRLTCRDADDGGGCNIPSEISAAVGKPVRGVCCQKTCRIGIQKCGSFCGDGVCTNQEGRDGNCQEDCGRMQQMDRAPPTDGELESIGRVGCIGAEEGAICILPKDMEVELGLSGVCCGGKCSYRKTACPRRYVASKPDLIVSSIEFSPPFPTEDDKVDVNVTLVNVGSASVNRSFWIRLRAEDNGKDVTDTDYEIRQELKPNDSVSHTFPGQLGLGIVGSFNLKVDVDRGSGNFPGRNNLIDELNDSEGNNFAAASVYVRQRADAIRTVCGNGICEGGEDGACPNDCAKEAVAGGGVPWYLVMLALAVPLAGIFAVSVFLIRSKKKVTAGGGEKSVDVLAREKAELENMLAIAKSKYHRRELDEESFREIVRDNQKKIIELELKIKVSGK
ncbi:MAG: hypothetical protein V1875_07050 [Candidatus Altiarchaeota archaeon]